MGLDMSKITELLEQNKTQERQPRIKKDVTEPREYVVWWRLRHTIRQEGCENPDCNDPRPSTDHGVNVVAEIKGKKMCRYCFLEGYLSDNSG
jgi:hypothetical protein